MAGPCDRPGCTAPGTPCARSIWPRTKDELPTHDPVLAALRAELGEAGLTAAMVSGGRLSIEQAAAEAAGPD